MAAPEYTARYVTTYAPGIVGEFFLHLSKAGKVCSSENARKATRFASKEDAQAAIDQREAHLARIERKNPNPAPRAWHLTAC